MQIIHLQEAFKSAKLLVVYFKPEALSFEPINKGE